MRNRLLMFVFALVLGAPLAQAKDPVQARKDLTSMGLSYNNTSQFLEVLRGKDQIAIDLFLAAKGIDLNARDPKTGKSALRIAYDARDSELTKRLIVLGAKPSSAELEETLKRNDRAMFFEMLRANPASLNEKITLMALDQKDRDLMRQTLAHIEREKALHVLTPVVLAEAMRIHKDISLIDEMLSRLGPATKEVLDRPAITEEVNEHRSLQGLRILTFAAAHHQSPDFDIVGLLVKYGADVNAVDAAIGRSKSNSEITSKLPATPLLHSVWTLNEHAVKALLKHGADPNVILVRQGGFLGMAYRRHTVLSYAESLKIRNENTQRRDQIVALLKGAGAKTPDELEAKSAAN